MVYDPKVTQERMHMDLQTLWEFRGESQAEQKEKLSKLKIASSAKAACNKAHALAVITEWDSFKMQDFNEIYSKWKNQPLFLTAEQF